MESLSPRERMISPSDHEIASWTLEIHLLPEATREAGGLALLLSNQWMEMTPPGDKSSEKVLRQHEEKIKPRHCVRESYGRRIERNTVEHPSSKMEGISGYDVGGQCQSVVVV